LALLFIKDRELFFVLSVVFLSLVCSVSGYFLYLLIFEPETGIINFKKDCTKNRSQFTEKQMKSANPEAYQSLVNKSMGDKELIERLVTYEY